MLDRLYKQQAQLEELKKKKEDSKMDAKDNTAYPREVLDMLARLYNASRENKDKEEEKLMRSSRMLERENNQTVRKEQGEEECEKWRWVSPHVTPGNGAIPHCPQLWATHCRLS